MTDQGPVLTVTGAAREKALWFRSRDPNAEQLALWLEVTGVSGGAYEYNMYLQLLDRATPEDAVQHHDDLPVVVPAGSIDALRGATLDRSGDLETGGILLDNPNRPPSASPAVGSKPPMDLSGDVPQRVLQVLERQINPSIASHGGRAELVAVEDDTAYLRLSGGCQGCGMASVTLNQGIEVALREAVPEIAKVVDVTDHAAGTNPYFETAKK
ncbi:MAG: iron-sulfur cluster assembly accessory protein [Nitriliruptorales bacterium]|nr:iron-sulfur cluster assembly accessory protein [Nitriliruptorales bacterium]